MMCRYHDFPLDKWFSPAPWENEEQSQTTCLSIFSYFWRYWKNDVVVFRFQRKSLMWNDITTHSYIPTLFDHSLIFLLNSTQTFLFEHSHRWTKYTNDRMNIILYLRVQLSLVNKLSLFILMPFYLFFLVIYYYYF